jgi:hypothetical protein
MPGKPVILSHVVIFYYDVCSSMRIATLKLPIHREESFSGGLGALAA